MSSIAVPREPLDVPDMPPIGPAEFGEPAGQRAGRSRRASRGPTPELKQAADELAGRVAKGQPVSPDDLRKIRSLVALDLIRSSRPTARAKGFEMLESACNEASSLSQSDALQALGLPLGYP